MYWDYDVIECIANSGIINERYFDVKIINVDENGEELDILFYEENVPSDLYEVFIPREYRKITREGCCTFRNKYTGNLCIAITIRYSGNKKES